ncbi:MAG: mycofactocin biosynthesis peptidyl-dipeptidase MftE [Candidatus Competibacteraceae bacterium]
MSRLAELSWPAVAQAVTAGITTAILPLGATEQHGPHLPLGTDTWRAQALADRLAGQWPALVAPVLPIGCSDEHSGFAGLLSLEHETLAQVIVDCARRLFGWGVRRLVILSAHGGNDRALTMAGERLARELPQLQLWIPAAMAIGDTVLAIAAGDGIVPESVGLHAGEGEASEMLHLRPELVRRERAAPGYIGDMTDVLPRLRENGLQPVTPNGVLGDPRRADASRGERYLSAQVACYRNGLAQWTEATPGGGA